jgi:hypothetical protein
MTATGKTTAARLTTADRVLITRESQALADLMGREPELIPATRLTGDDVETVRVLGVTSALVEPEYGHRRVRVYTVTTTAGTLEVFGQQTFILAPETPAAVKRAHVAALAEDAERADHLEALVENAQRDLADTLETLLDTEAARDVQESVEDFMARYGVADYYQPLTTFERAAGVAEPPSRTGLLSGSVPPCQCGADPHTDHAEDCQMELWFRQYEAATGN